MKWGGGKSKSSSCIAGNSYLNHTISTTEKSRENRLSVLLRNYRNINI